MTIDAHFHIWRQADLPWLADPMQPQIFGPNEAIRRDYPVEEYLSDIEGAGITAAVHVQSGWPPERAEDEVAWVGGVAAATGWPMAIVAFADMTVADARPALDRLARHDLVRGVRQGFHWHTNPAYRFADRPDLAADETVQRNIARLTDYGWSFDVQVFADQMEGVADLADACPDVTLVLHHAGMLEDVSEPGRAVWRENMARLAARPNVAAKLSGFGTFIRACDPAHIAWLTRETVGLFGADRCLFGSNFPIEKLWTGYADLIAAHRAAAADLPDYEREAIFETTARRVYRLAR